MPSHPLPPARRIRRRGEFQHVFEVGRRAHGRYLTIVSAPSTDGASWLGIVASRKIGGAVVRNRAKRLIREVVRTGNGPAVPSDLVVIAKAAVTTAKVDGVRSDFQMTLKRLGLSNS